MPEISRFFSIRITMYYDEHRPPHFHAEYNGQKAEMSSPLSSADARNSLGHYPPGRASGKLE